MVLQHILHLHRTERAKSYMQRHMGNLHTHVLNLGQKLFREMQSCCRSCRGAVMLCVYGLVTVLVL